MSANITIYTRVYNTEKFLPQCLNSVIAQRYKGFQHLIFDNGCTDGCTKILQDYARQYPWVKLIRYEENQRTINCAEWIDTLYFTVLDSDDWWDPDYLERLIGFLENYDLDMAITGTYQYFEKSGDSQIMRKLAQPVVLTQKQFAQNYPAFWTFPSTMWASVQKAAVYKGTDFTGTTGLAYGGDTMQMLQYIRQCARIGIDNSALYHYRIHPKSVSYQYNPRRFDANIAYYERIRDFLELHHTFDPPKQEWLKRVHLSSMRATMEVLKNANASEDEKAAECARIATHPLTAAALANDCEEREQWYAVMREIVFHALSDGTLSDAESLGTALRILSPHCCGSVQTENLGLFAQEAALRDALQKDDQSGLAASIIALIRQKKYEQQYDLGKILGGLIPDGSPLRGITDTRFFWEYGESCLLILEKNDTAALDQMTGLLFERQKLYDGERFLNVYLSIAALENQVPAFLFGKLRLARLYLEQNRREECRIAVDELAEMGLDNEELTALRQELEGAP